MRNWFKSEILYNYGVFALERYVRVDDEFDGGFDFNFAGDDELFGGVDEFLCVYVYEPYKPVASYYLVGGLVYFYWYDDVSGRVVRRWRESPLPDGVREFLGSICERL